MATVALARTPHSFGLPDLIALKFLNPDLLEASDLRDAFEQEARLGTLLRHPSLCRAYGMHRADGRSAIVMEHVPGFSLGRLYRLAHLLGSAQERSIAIARIGLCLAEGLHAIHQARDEDGIELRAVHRDVSPQNVIVSPDGGVKLIDFGVMYSVGRRFKTRKGFVKGKLAYMAPEYLLARSWNHQIDIWSLGVILWELIVGQRLFPAAEPSQFMRAMASLSIPAPLERRPDIAPELSHVVENALKRRPRARYPSADRMAQELAAYLAEHTPDQGRDTLATWLGRMAKTSTTPHLREERTASTPAPWDAPTWHGSEEP